MKCRGNQLLMRAFVVRALSFSAVAALTLNPALTPVVASDYRAVAPVAAQLYDHADDDAVPEARPTWTPQPLPKPLHLSRGTIAASAMASIDAATELRRAAARAEIERAGSCTLAAPRWKTATYAMEATPRITRYTEWPRLTSTTATAMNSMATGRMV